jgi:FeS assembly SUF system protein
VVGDDIERLKIHKIEPRSTSDHVFLPRADGHSPPTEPVSEAYAGTGEEPTVPIDPQKVEAAIIEALQTIYDPEIPVNIYELGLIYGVEVSEDGRAEVRMTLTAPACPVAGAIVEEVAEKSGHVEGVSTAHVELVWDPPWTPERTATRGSASRRRSPARSAAKPKQSARRGREDYGWGWAGGVIGPLLPLAAELIFFAFEQDVEARQGAVAAGDVLLELHLLFVAQVLVAVDLLFEHAELVANHDDLLEEHVEGDAFLLRSFFAGDEHELPVVPAVSELDVAHTELIEKDLAEDLSKGFLIHVDSNLRGNGGSWLGSGLVPITAWRSCRRLSLQCLVPGRVLGLVTRTRRHILERPATLPKATIANPRPVGLFTLADVPPARPASA